MTTGDVDEWRTKALAPGRYWLPAPQPPVGGAPAALFPVEAIRKNFPILSQRVNGRPLIWLDNGATTQKPQQVIDTVVDYYRRNNSNVHRGAHELARRATDAYEHARATVARFLGAAHPQEIIFVRGVTEAANLVAQGWGPTAIREGDEIVLTELEHHSNIVPWQQLAKRQRATLRVVPVTDSGELDLRVYRSLLGPRTKLVAITHASNVLGTVPPLNQIIAEAHQHGARVFVDGAQAAAHLPVNVRLLDADFYAISGHKLFAPTGIGALFAKSEILEDMPPWQAGGGMIDHVDFDHTTFAGPPQRFEAGTGHIAGAVGLAAAIDYLDTIGLNKIARYERDLTTHATRQLSSIPHLTHLGAAPDKIGVLTFVPKHTSAEHVARELDRHGVAVRAGHHCAQPALRRYNITSAVRISLALYNTTSEIDTATRILNELLGASVT
jgi:cysteine desulfurase/selenocysteine lyase